MGAIRKTLHPEVIRLRIAGMLNTEIARQLKVPHQNIAETLKLPEVQAAVEEAHAEAREAVVAKLKASASEALDVLVRLATNADGQTPHAVQRQAASDLLDRAGFERGLNLDVQHTANVSAEIRAMLGRFTDEQLDEALGVETRDDFALLTVLEGDDEP